MRPTPEPPAHPGGRRRTRHRELRLRTDSGSAGPPRERKPGELWEGSRPRALRKRVSRRRNGRREDLEGERSPGRTVRIVPVTTPVRRARTRRWSKALKRPALLPAPPLSQPRKGERGWGRSRCPIDSQGALAVTSVAEEGLPVDVWRSTERSVGQSPSDRRGRPDSRPGCASGRVGGWRPVELQEVQRPR